MVLERFAVGLETALVDAVGHLFVVALGDQIRDGAAKVPQELVACLRTVDDVACEQPAGAGRVSSHAAS